MDAAIKEDNKEDDGSSNDTLLTGLINENLSQHQERAFIESINRILAQ